MSTVESQPAYPDIPRNARVHHQVAFNLRDERDLQILMALEGHKEFAGFVRFALRFLAVQRHPGSELFAGVPEPPAGESHVA